MNQQEQVQFIHDLVDTIEHELLIQVVEGKIPAEWDGIELRWLLAQRFDAHRVMPEARRRKREFNNTVLVNNL